MFVVRCGAVRAHPALGGVCIAAVGAEPAGGLRAQSGIGDKSKFATAGTGVTAWRAHAPHRRRPRTRSCKRPCSAAGAPAWPKHDARTLAGVPVDPIMCVQVYPDSTPQEEGGREVFACIKHGGAQRGSGWHGGTITFF